MTTALWHGAQGKDNGTRTTQTPTTPSQPATGYPYTPPTRIRATTMPQVFDPNQSSQYHIWCGQVVIESTGYFPSLAAAKRYVRARYNAPSELKLQPCYPVLYETKIGV